MAVEKHLTTEAAKWRHRTYYKRRAKILKGIPSVFITYQKKTRDADHLRQTKANRNLLERKPRTSPHGDKGSQALDLIGMNCQKPHGRP